MRSAIRTLVSLTALWHLVFFACTARGDAERAPDLRVTWYRMVPPQRSIANSGARWWKPGERCYQRCGARGGIWYWEHGKAELEVRCFCKDRVVVYDTLMPFDVYEPVDDWAGLR